MYTKRKRLLFRFVICAVIILGFNTFVYDRFVTKTNTAILEECEITYIRLKEVKEPNKIDLRTFECLKFEEGLITEKDVSDALIKKGKSIFFIESSCKSRINGSINLNARQACAIEAAAYNNPNWDVIVLVAAPAAINVSAVVGKYIPAVLSYRNVKIYSLNTDRYFQDTPVEGLWKSGNLHKSNNSKWRVSHLSDVLRYLTLWKYGGIYLDLDVYATHSFDELHPNFVGLEDNKGIGSSVVGLATDDRTHQWMTECLEHLNKSYRHYIWRWNGNGLIERCLYKICSPMVYEELNKNPSNLNICSGRFEIYPSKVFYPVPWWEWQKYFKKEHKDEMLGRLKGTRAVHLTNNLSWKERVNISSNESFYEYIAQTYCPRVYSFLDDEL